MSWSTGEDGGTTCLAEEGNASDRFVNACFLSEFADEARGDLLLWLWDERRCATSFMMRVHRRGEKERKWSCVSSSCAI